MLVIGIRMYFASVFKDTHWNGYAAYMDRRERFLTSYCKFNTLSQI